MSCSPPRTSNRTSSHQPGAIQTGRSAPAVAADRQEQLLLREVRQQADNSKVLIQQIETILDRVKSKEDDAAKSVGLDREGKRHFLPWLAEATAVNVLLWISMLFMIFKMDLFGSHRDTYLGVSSVMFFVPLILSLFLLWSPVPSSLQRVRTAVRDKFTGTSSPVLKPILNIANCFTCFVLVFVYICASAIPRYNELQWTSGIEFETEARFPSVAFLVAPFPGFDSNGPGTSDHDDMDCSLLAREAANNSFCTLKYTRSGADGQTILYLDASAIAQGNAWGMTVELDLDYMSNALSFPNPWIDIALFDSRLLVHEAMDCGLAQTISMPVGVENKVTITPRYVTDKYWVPRNKSLEGSPCSDLIHETLARQKPPHTEYQGAVTSLRSVNESASALAGKRYCPTVVAINFGTNFISTMETRHSIGALGIWLNAGAIVGGVQFFAWLATMFLD